VPFPTKPAQVAVSCAYPMTRTRSGAKRRYMIVGTLFDLAIQFGAYWLGRGAARVWKRSRQVSN